MKKVLLSTQRMFTLSICRAYRTTSSDSLLVLTGLETVDLVIAREVAFTNVISFGVSTHCFGRSWKLLYEIPPRSLLHPANKSISISLEENWSTEKTEFKIFSNGSKLIRELCLCFLCLPPWIYSSQMLGQIG
ncbi:hypothetical protein AVEN_201884-1 [Araneus ventricosus]|uniref:Uncharacterized protein n=1 Tax=Araneus ventricosus TaxID=182803 RepID=A0A4Y2G2V0_ARAVE|nr:hypothetical protein AVEN_201884-1 [Araneus ventricosus]